MATITIEVESAAGKPRHARLERWVEEVAQLCKPARIHWCDGSTEEYEAILRLLVLVGTAIPLDAAKRPEQLPRALRPCGRGARRGPDFHLFPN